MAYHYTERKRDVLHLSTLIGEKVTVVTETVDYDTAVLSIAMNTKAGVDVVVCFALRRREMQHVRDALTRILTPEPGEPA
jgi:hypothetical protein